MRYLRNPPTPSESRRAAVIATAIGAGVGLLAFYFARLLVAREPVDVAREMTDVPRLPPSQSPGTDASRPSIASESGAS